jgi:hypothetical protein
MENPPGGGQLEQGACLKVKVGRRPASIAVQRIDGKRVGRRP